VCIECARPWVPSSTRKRKQKKRNLHTDFHSGYTHSPSHQQWGSPSSLHPHFGVFVIAMQTRVTWNFTILMSLMSSDIKLFFTYIVAICISSLCKCSDHLSIFTWIVLLLFLNSLCILNINHLTNIFTHCISCFFSFKRLKVELLPDPAIPLWVYKQRDQSQFTIERHTYPCLLKHYSQQL
jgi:hypothetical protein